MEEFDDGIRRLQQMQQLFAPPLAPPPTPVYKTIYVPMDPEEYDRAVARGTIVHGSDEPEIDKEEVKQLVKENIALKAKIVELEREAANLRRFYRYG